MKWEYPTTRTTLYKYNLLLCTYTTYIFPYSSKYYMGLGLTVFPNGRVLTFFCFDYAEKGKSVFTPPSSSRVWEKQFTLLSRGWEEKEVQSQCFCSEKKYLSWILNGGLPCNRINWDWDWEDRLSIRVLKCGEELQGPGLLIYFHLGVCWVLSMLRLLSSPLPSNLKTHKLLRFHLNNSESSPSPIIAPSYDNLSLMSGGRYLQVYL
jgi:hypothetical protein